MTFLELCKFQMGAQFLQQKQRLLVYHWILLPIVKLLTSFFLIFSDSLSVLKSLDHTSSKYPQIQKLLEKHPDLAECNEIIYCWIPSHISIAGNENVDKIAKHSPNLHPTNFLLPYSNFKSFINRYIVNKWQILENNSVRNKLFEIKPVIGQSQPEVRNARREEVVLVRLRIVHTRTTHSYLLKTRSFGCDAPFTVRNFLLECGDFSHIKTNIFMLIQTSNCLMMYIQIMSSYS